MKKLVIEISDDQYKMIQEHLGKNTIINIEEETFSGHSFKLICSGMGYDWLEVEMNSKIDIGEVNWKFE